MDEICLKFNKRYLVETKNKNHYIGTYRGFIRDPQYGCVGYYVLDNVTNYYTNYYIENYPHILRKTKPEKLRGEVCFKPTDTFYDLEEIRENGKKARQTMEQRSLDMILKRLVNENFKWS